MRNNSTAGSLIIGQSLSRISTVPVGFGVSTQIASGDTGMDLTVFVLEMSIFFLFSLKKRTSSGKEACCQIIEELS